MADISVQDTAATAREVLTSLRFWVLTGAYGLALLGSAVVFAPQIAYLVSQGYGSLLAASLARALGLTSSPGRFFLNLLSACVLPQTVLAGTLLVQAAGILVLILAPSALWLWLYVLLYGWFCPGRTPHWESSPTRERASRSMRKDVRPFPRTCVYEKEKARRLLHQTKGTRKQCITPIC
jgi:uncharacterized MFS-type transporter YbfB